MMERYTLLEVKILISEQRKRAATADEIQKARKETGDFLVKVTELLFEFNKKQSLCHLNIYGIHKDPCPTNIEEGDIIDLSTNFLN